MGRQSSPQYEATILIIISSKYSSLDIFQLGPHLLLPIDKNGLFSTPNTFYCVERLLRSGESDNLSSPAVGGRIMSSHKIAIS